MHAAENFALEETFAVEGSFNPEKDDWAIVVMKAPDEIDFYRLALYRAAMHNGTIDAEMDTTVEYTTSIGGQIYNRGFKNILNDIDTELERAFYKTTPITELTPEICQVFPQSFFNARKRRRIGTDFALFPPDGRDSGLGNDLPDFKAIEEEDIDLDWLESLFK